MTGPPISGPVNALDASDALPLDLVPGGAVVESRRPRSGRNAVAAFAEVAFSGVTLFLLYRVLYAHVALDSIGVWSVLVSLTSLARLGDLGVGSALLRFASIARQSDDPTEAPETIETAIVSVVVFYGMLAVAIGLAIVGFAGDVLSGQVLIDARSLVPWIVATFWASSVAVVVASALGGNGRFDLKAYVSIGSTALLLVVAWILVPRFGIAGVGVAQVTQALFALSLNWIVLRREVPHLHALPRTWSGARFRGLAGFGVRLQGITIAALLFDPATKVLMAAFGGFSSAAYYDIASRVVVLVRNALGGAQQTLVPRFAASIPRTGYRTVYNAAMDWTWLLSPVSFAMLFVSAPLLSLMWAGSYQPEFVAFVAVLAPAWLLSSLGTPAFFLGIGTGRLTWNIAGQVTTTAANACLGLMLGASFGSTGVTLAAALSVSAGSALVIGGIHNSHALDRSALLSVGHLNDLTLALVSCALGGLAILVAPEGLPEIIRFAIGPSVFFVATSIGFIVSLRRRRMLAGVASPFGLSRRQQSSGADPIPPVER